MDTVNLLAVEAGQIILWVLIGVMLIAMIVLPMFSNRKRQKEVNEMLNTIDVGDEIMTLGGIMGKVVSLTTHESGEKLMTIETGEGAEKSTMTFTVQALRLNYTKNKQRQQALAAQKQAELEAKAAKEKAKEEAKDEAKSEEATAETAEVKAEEVKSETTEVKPEEAQATAEAKDETKTEETK